MPDEPEEVPFAPQQDHAQAPEHNVVHCLYDGELYEPSEPGSLECPVNPEHDTEPAYETTEPMGYRDDDDFYHHGRKTWVYPAKRPEGT